MEENQNPSLEFTPGERVLWGRRIFSTATKPKVEEEVTFLYSGKRARIRLDSGAERNVQISSLRKLPK